MGSSERILSRGITLYKLYFRINNLASLCGERTNCKRKGGSRKPSVKGYCKSPGSDERGSDQGCKSGSGEEGLDLGLLLKVKTAGDQN